METETRNKYRRLLGLVQNNRSVTLTVGEAKANGLKIESRKHKYSWRVNHKKENKEILNEYSDIEIVCWVMCKVVGWSSRRVAKLFGEEITHQKVMAKVKQVTG